MRPLSARLQHRHHDGWKAYGRYLTAIKRLWAEAASTGMTLEAFRAAGGSPVADPAAFAPNDLDDDARLHWCLGWSQHQADVAVRHCPAHRGATNRSKSTE